MLGRGEDSASACSVLTWIESPEGISNADDPVHVHLSNGERKTLSFGGMTLDSESVGPRNGHAALLT
jgi:hypothetical protein